MLIGFVVKCPLLFVRCFANTLDDSPQIWICPFQNCPSIFAGYYCQSSLICDSLPFPCTAHRRFASTRNSARNQQREERPQRGSFGGVSTRFPPFRRLRYCTEPQLVTRNRNRSVFQRCGISCPTFLRLSAQSLQLLSTGSWIGVLVPGGRREDVTS